MFLICFSYSCWVCVKKRRGVPETAHTTCFVMK
jgi:hypothetical protein